MCSLTSMLSQVYHAGMKVFGVFAILLLSFFIFSKPASAQAEEDVIQEDLVMMEVEKTPTASPSPSVKNIDYELPYPGMLPDNPLYFLKGIRDKIIEILISDPVKKGEFYVLSSDKRLNSGYYLIQKGKQEMGVLYISKSTNYMHMAVGELIKAGEKGKDTLSTAQTAIKKHKEIITMIRAKIDKKYKTELSDEIERLEQIETLINGKKQ